MSSVSFLFPGQGSQKLHMGKDLYDNFSSARLVFDEVSDALGIDIASVIFGDDPDLVNRTDNAQPALMVVSMAAVRVLESEVGVNISNMEGFCAGHSLGEYTALCASGYISLQDTAKLLRVRGRAMQLDSEKNPGGMMALLGVDIDKARNFVSKVAKLSGGVCCVANNNGGGQIVISGDKNSMEVAIREVKAEEGMRGIPLKVSGAFHTPLMMESRYDMEKCFSDVKINMDNKMKVIQNFTASLAKDADEMKSWLISGICGPVMWEETVLSMKNLGVRYYVELGSGSVLSNLVKKICGISDGFSAMNFSDSSQLSQVLSCVCKKEVECL